MKLVADDVNARYAYREFFRKVGCHFVHDLGMRDVDFRKRIRVVPRNFSSLVCLGIQGTFFLLRVFSVSLVTKHSKLK